MHGAVLTIFNSDWDISSQHHAVLGSSYYQGCGARLDQHRSAWLQSGRIHLSRAWVGHTAIPYLLQWGSYCG
jgi:hypothetical protein